MLAALIWTACADPSDCAALGAPEARDRCWYDTAAEAGAPEAQAALARIEDPIVRGAGVLTWIQAHPTALDADVWPLCEMLTATEKKACERRLRAAHLRH